MTNCPKCGEAIDHLVVTQRVMVTSVGTFDLEGYKCDQTYDDSLNEQLEADTPEPHFECPKCGHELCTEKEEAIAFLKGQIDKKLQPAPDEAEVDQYLADEYDRQRDDRLIDGDE